MGTGGIGQAQLRVLAALLASGAVTGCAGGADRSDAGADAGEPCPGSLCLSGHTRPEPNDDVLFVVDDSPAMAGAQVWLRDWLPALAHMLVDGVHEREDGSVRTWPPVTNLHLGVVSADMGLPAVTGVTGCDNTGDDGRLRHDPDPRGDGCRARYPSFLRYNHRLTTPDSLPGDLACIGTLGARGCDVPQPLEAALKALWPPVGADPVLDDTLDPPDFLRLAEAPTPRGHGDGYNAGFLRSDPDLDRSLFAVVVVTNRDDCSTPDPAFLTPADQLAADDPLRAQHPSTRCMRNEGHLYSLERYLSGLEQLRRRAGSLVRFGAIVGVPPDLTEPFDADGNLQVDMNDEAQREAWYAAMLADPRMQPRVDDSDPRPDNQPLLPSCTAAEDGTGVVAYPPRRLVQLARQFGSRGSVQSICGGDPRIVLWNIFWSDEIPAGHWRCLDAPLSPDADQLLACTLRWELPPDDRPAAEDTPRRCDGRPFLQAPPSGQPSRTAEGGAICVLPQLPTATPAQRTAASVGGDAARDRLLLSVEAVGDGWYYDDFSTQVDRVCWRGAMPEPARIAFTHAAYPPAGVEVRFECE